MCKIDYDVLCTSRRTLVPEKVDEGVSVTRCMKRGGAGGLGDGQGDAWKVGVTVANCHKLSS